MNRSAFAALGLTGALVIVSAPAFAQHHRDGGEGRHDNAAPRTERRESRPEQQAQPRQQEQRQEQRAAPRQQEQRAVPRQDYRRQYSAPRYEQRYSAPRYDSGRYYGSRYSGPRFSIAPRRYFRPYYVFRPRLSIGFGIWAGYPITYYDPYYYPYDYYGYSASVGPGYPPPPPGSVNVQPGYQPNQGNYPSNQGNYPPNQGNYPANQANMGGLSFDITPDTAEVYVDGNYFGEVGQFTSSSQPLGLPAGRHRVELREPGYASTPFDVDIVAGQVLPYQGQLQR